MTSPVILAPTDFSKESLRALDYASLLLKSFGGTLHLVHVHDMDSTYAIPPVVSMPPVLSPGETDRLYQGRLRKLAAKYSAQREVHTHVRVGRAFDQICCLADEIAAQFIVISTHGHTGLKRLFLGSTAEQVVRHALCPVLVVREHERDFADLAPRRPGQVTKRQMKILVPIDFSECAQEGLSYAIAFARPWSAKLILLHTVQVQPIIAPEHLAAYERMPSLESLESAAKAEMQRLTSSTDFGDVQYETAVQVGDPAQQICQYADDRGIDLIITPTHGRTGFAHVLIGSVAEHVVRYAQCPVLVVPTRKKKRTP